MQGPRPVQLISHIVVPLPLSLEALLQRDFLEYVVGY